MVVIGGETVPHSSMRDQLGHEIYLTEERWRHICEEHPEMHRLPYMNTTMVVGVRFGLYPDGTQNNFVLTAYPMRRRRK